MVVDIILHYYLKSKLIIKTNCFIKILRIMAHERYQECIDACQECATICTHCASECLKENDVQNLADCLRLDLECAAICRSAAELMSMGSEYSERLCNICADICFACAQECDRHAEHMHCAECAETCRSCAKACSSMVEETV